jgi:hypothetical protein
MTTGLGYVWYPTAGQLSNPGYSLQLSGSLKGERPSVRWTVLR